MSDRYDIAAILRARDIHFEAHVKEGLSELEVDGIGSQVHFLFDFDGKLQNVAGIEHRPAVTPETLDNDFLSSCRAYRGDPGDECEACT